MSVYGLMREQEKHQYYMKMAIDEALLAREIGEVPVGAVIVNEHGQVLSRGHNNKEREGLCTRHAEIVAIENASRALHNWRLLNCTIYITLEPCLMCAGAIQQSRLMRVVYGARDPKGGACESLYQVLTDQRLNHQVELLAGVMSEESSLLLSQFFKNKRGL